MRAESSLRVASLLFGNTLETNSLFLSEELMLIGIEACVKTVVAITRKIWKNRFGGPWTGWMSSSLREELAHEDDMTRKERYQRL